MPSSAAPPPGAAIEPMMRGMQLIALCCLVFAGLLVVARSGTGPSGNEVLLAVYAAAAAGIAVLWLWRERTPRPRAMQVATVLSLVCAVPVTMLGSVGFTIPALLLVVALAAVDLGTPAAVVAAVAIMLPGLVLQLLSGHGWLTALVNVLPVLVMLGFGVLLGAALCAYRMHLSQRDRALAEAHEAAEALRRAAATETELVLSEERARAARELHDGLGHRLTVIRMALEFAERMRERDPEAAWTEITAARTTSSEALEEMRLWVRALSPVRGGQGSVVGAIASIADSFRGTGLRVQVSADPELDALDHERALVLYRAAQEGLTNALRHAQARHVAITASRTADAAVLRLVSDFSPERAAVVPAGPFAPGFGLRGLAERVQALQGSLRAERIGEQALLEVTVPIGQGGAA